MTQTKSCSCGCNGERLVFACSGAADIGAIADQAARKIARQGAAKMFCLAGVGARLADFVDRTRAAAKVVVIDGCDKDCGKHVMEDAGITKFAHVRVTDLGMEKGKTPVDETHIDAVAAKAAAAF